VCDAFGTPLGGGSRRGSAGEPVGETDVGPAHDRGPERQTRTQVEARQHMHQADVGAAVQIDSRGDHQHDVQQRNTCEDGGARPSQPHEVAQHHAKAQQDPQADLATHYHRRDRILGEERQHCLLNFHAFGSTFVLLK
jgi:hypothetical protein